MIAHSQLSDEQLRKQIKAEVLRFAGNKKLKIFGLLNCKSGKRMLKSNRVFFNSQAEAVNCGYRPCGHCLKAQYQIWKRLSSNR